MLKVFIDSLYISLKESGRSFKVLPDLLYILSKHSLRRKSMRMATNEWQCYFNKSEDFAEIVKVNIAVYDLYIEE